MSDFENALLNGLPLADAAAFHVQLLGYDRPKVATAGGMAPPALPPTATGQQMPAPAPVTLPGTAMGQNTVKQAEKTPEEIGKERARASISAEHEKDRAHKREHAGGMAGSLTGAAVGGMAMHKYTKGHPFGAVAGMLAGHHIAGKTGREIGAIADRHAAKQASLDMAKLGAAVKRAFEGVQNAGMGMGASSPVDPQQAAQALDEPPAPAGPITPSVDEATQQYLAAQQEATEMADTNAAAFYQQKLEVMREQLQQAQEQAATLQAGQETHQAEIAQIQAQVADSTQKAVAASDQVLKEQQAAAAMRMAYQQLRGQILNTVSSDPPMMGADQAAMAAASTGAAPSSAPDPSAGPAPAPGTPPGSPAPEGDPTVPNADGIAMSKPMMDTAQPATAVGQKEQTGDAKIPQKEVLASVMRKAFDEVKKRAPGAAVGAALGAVAGHIDSKREHGAAKSKVLELGGKHDRSYSEAKALGKARQELTVSDYAKKHPGAHAARSAVTGAALGGLLGPQIGKGLRASREHISGARAVGK